MKKYRVNKVDHEVSDEKFNYNTTAELNPDATLGEIKKMVGTTEKYKKEPGTRYLRCCEDIVAATTNAENRMEVYSNGFAIYQTSSTATVLRMEWVGRALYPDDPSVEIPVQDIDLADMSWKIAVMICGDERLDKWGGERDADAVVYLSDLVKTDEDSGETGELEIDAGIDIEGNYIQQESWNELLSILTRKQRVCVKMYYESKMTEREIAKVLGVSWVEVSKLIKKALKAIEKNLKNFEKGVNKTPRKRPIR